MKLVLKRSWLVPSLLNCLRAPYIGYVDGKEIGFFFCNPVTKELLPESKEYLKKLGHTDYEIEFQN